MRLLLFLIICLGGWIFSLNVVKADNSGLPGGGFAASRYQDLWTKSPFAVASSEEGGASSPDYALVGIAEFDGVSYASLIDKQKQEHFLLAGDKPERGLTLVSVTRGHESSDTKAILQKNGQTLILKLEADPPSLANGGAPAGLPSAQQIPMPGDPNAARTDQPNSSGTGRRPPVTIRARTVIIPPAPMPIKAPETLKNPSSDKSQ